MAGLLLKTKGSISHGGSVSFKQNYKAAKKANAMLAFLMYLIITFSSFSHKVYFSAVKPSEIRRLNDSMHPQWPALSVWR